jgi:N-acetylmuramoyl-L-alanine amidase
MRLLRMLSLLAIFGSSGFVNAQTAFRLNGIEISGLALNFVPGVAYAPAKELANAIGAKYVFDRFSLRATFELAGRILQIHAVTNPEEAIRNDNGLSLNGSPLLGPTGIISKGFLLVPLKIVVEAFGGNLTFLTEENTVVGVLPRATVERVRVIPSTSADRIAILFAQPIPHTAFYNAPLNTLRIRFERTDVPLVKSFSGTTFSQADLIPGAGFSELRVVLDPGFKHHIFELIAEAGFEFVIDIIPDREGEALPPTAHQRIVIDPGHGGEEGGQIFRSFGREADLVLGFSERLKSALQTLGHVVESTRTSNANHEVLLRSGRGFAANLFVSIHAGDHPRGQYSIFYLEEAEGIAGLKFAVRENAAREASRLSTDGVRRQILLNLIPNLDMGRRFAFALNEIMFQSAGYVANTPKGAPLAVLAAAGGRGLLLEFGPEDLNSPTLVRALAGALSSLATGGF